MISIPCWGLSNGSGLRLQLLTAGRREIHLGTTGTEHGESPSQVTYPVDDVWIVYGRYMVMGQKPDTLMVP